MELPIINKVFHESLHALKQGLESFRRFVFLDRFKNQWFQLIPGHQLSRVGFRLACSGSRLTCAGSHLTPVGSRLTCAGSRLTRVGSRLTCARSRLVLEGVANLLKHHFAPWIMYVIFSFFNFFGSVLKFSRHGGEQLSSLKFTHAAFHFLLQFF